MTANYDVWHGPNKLVPSLLCVPRAGVFATLGLELPHLCLLQGAIFGSLVTHPPPPPSSEQQHSCAFSRNFTVLASTLLMIEIILGHLQ